MEPKCWISTYSITEIQLSAFSVAPIRASLRIIGAAKVAIRSTAPQSKAVRSVGTKIKKGGLHELPEPGWEGWSDICIDLRDTADFVFRRLSRGALPGRLGARGPIWGVMFEPP